MPNPAVAQPLDNKGADFIIAFLPNPLSPNQQFVELNLASDAPTTVTVQYPLNAPTFNISVLVNPGNVTVVSLPTSVAEAWPIDGIANNTLRAFADEEFVCYLLNHKELTSDAALALPIDTMNTEYIVMDYTPSFAGAEFIVYAAFDNTTVAITPANAIVGHAAGVPFEVVLDRGEGYLASSSVILGLEGTLIGTTISADRPVGLANGNGCARVPFGVNSCDHVFEIAQPVQSWGTEALVVNLPNRPEGSVYRILASVDGTNVTQDGAPLGSINRGQFIEIGPIAGAHHFSANHPILVAQFMTGDTSPGATDGDPSMGNMIPPDQYLSDYTFSTIPGPPTMARGFPSFAQTFVSVIAENADVATLLLDGGRLGADAFTPIGDSGFSSAVLAVSPGDHTSSSNGVHGITVEGYSPFVSYLYPGGTRSEFINPVGDANPPACSCDFIGGPPPSGSCTATDNQPSEDVNGNGVLDPGEDLNGNGLIDEDAGIFFVELEPGAVNLTLNVDPFVPADGSVNFSVGVANADLDGSGTIRVTDGAGNICQTPVSLTLITPPEITCPENVTITSGESTAPVNTGSAGAEGDCPSELDITLSDNLVNSACTADPVHFTIERTWTAADDCGNSNSCVQIITVLRKVVSLIIKQGACPAPLNPSSHGVVPMLLTGDTDFDVEKVLLNTLHLTRCDCSGGDVAPNDGPPGPKIMIVDLNHPFDGGVDCGDGPCACNADQTSDGIDDISMKFRTDQMMADLPLAEADGVVILSVTGELDEPAYPPGQINLGFIASDCVLIVPPGGQGPVNATVEANALNTFVELTPLDLNVDSDGFTDFGRAYLPGTSVTLTAPAHAGGRPFLRWAVDGTLQAIGVRTIEIEIADDVSLRAVYGPPSPIESDQPAESDGPSEIKGVRIKGDKNQRN